MPVVTISIDESLAEQKGVVGETLCGAVSDAVNRWLKPKPGTFQWIARWGDDVGPSYPVYLQIQFRESDERGADVVASLMQELAQVIKDHLNAESRIRAFAIDQAILFARDS